MSDANMELIRDCAGQFEFYVRQHMAKMPPDVGKAEANMIFANRCRIAGGLNAITISDLLNQATRGDY